MNLKLNWTLTFLAVCVVVFLFQMMGLVDILTFGFTPALAIQQPWTFVTSMFMHGDITHLFFNMFALAMFGLILESKIGSRNFFIVYFLSGIAGSIGYIITTSNPNIPAIGASGAVYGIMGTLAVLMPAATVWFGGFVPMPMAFAVVFWTLSEFFGLFAPSGIAHGAHLFGLFIGLGYGFLLRKQEHRTMHRRIKLDGYADWET
ncbi:MAG: rhomboid family intramembrane serine protease [Candidatus Aenigmarchaeota archaeon]|nr:rhomboid family intramembrane serine protease [Candidatus Aenigmarchaeota archaeon]